MAFELRKTVPLEATPEEVWHAIATPGGLAAWFMPMPIDPSSELVDLWLPPERLEVKAGPQEFDYVIEGAPPGAVLHFTHRMEEDLVDQFSPGWDMYFHTLAQYFRFFRGRAAQYVEEEAGEWSASESAWGAIVAAAKGLDGEVDYETAQFLGVRTDRSLIRFHGRWPLGMRVAVSEHVYDGGGPTQDWGSWLEAVQP